MIRDPLRTVSVSLVVAFASAGPLLAQEQKTEKDQAQLIREVDELKKGQAEIRKELADIKRLLQQLQAPPARAAVPSGPNVAGKVFDLGTNPSRGERTAPLTLVEFTDYQ